MNKVKREPSIHISKSLFRKLWNEIGDKVSEEFVDKFFTRARQYSLDHRSVIGDNKPVRKKAISRTSGSIGDANLLADIIYSTRIQKKVERNSMSNKKLLEQKILYISLKIL